MERIKRLTAIVGAACALATGVGGVAGAAASAPAAIGSATGYDPYYQLKIQLDRPGADGFAADRGTQTPYVMSAGKAAALKAHTRLGVTPHSCNPYTGCTGGVAGSVAMTQQGQEANNWCGPASLVETLRQDGGYIGSGTWGTSRATAQGWAARVLGTGYPGGSGTGGTGWNQQDAFSSALNSYNNHGGYYDKVSVGSPYGDYVTDFMTRMESDINTGWGMAAVAYEVPNGPHLVGHPNSTIYHFFNIYGYDDSASTTKYEDSATTVWSSVPPYSNYNTSTLVEIISGRQYYW